MPTSNGATDPEHNANHTPRSSPIARRLQLGQLVLLRRRTSRSLHLDAACACAWSVSLERRDIWKNATIPGDLGIRWQKASGTIMPLPSVYSELAGSPRWRRWSYGGRGKPGPDGPSRIASSHCLHYPRRLLSRWPNASRCPIRTRLRNGRARRHRMTCCAHHHPGPSRRRKHVCAVWQGLPGSGNDVNVRRWAIGRSLAA